MPAASRNDFYATVEWAHGVDSGAHLYEAPSTVDVAPQGGAMSAVEAILVPWENHSVTWKLEVGLIDELLQS